MRRLFPILAAVAFALMLAHIATGAEASRVESRPPICAMAAVVLFQVSALIRAGVARMRVEGWAERSGLPEWVGGLAERNASKAMVSACSSIGMMALLLGSDDWGWAGEAGRLGIRAANLAFQAGTFAGEFVIMRAQAKLLRDVESWAGKPVAGGIVAQL